MTNVVEQSVSVFQAISTWFVSAITDMLPLFYEAESGLTILGTMCLMGLGVGIILMVAMFIKNFFKWR